MMIQTKTLMRPSSSRGRAAHMGALMHSRGEWTPRRSRGGDRRKMHVCAHGSDTAEHRCSVPVLPAAPLPPRPAARVSDREKERKMFRHNDPAWSAHPDTGAADELPVTTETHEALECEVAKLVSEKERDIPERLRAARENGDGSSNDEFLAIREGEIVTDARTARLKDVLSRARVIDPAESGSTIAIGSAVLVKDLESGAEIDYVIDSAHAASAPGAAPAVSPVGAALRGRPRGERVTVELPNGRRRKLQVLAIKPL